MMNDIPVTAISSKANLLPIFSTALFCLSTGRNRRKKKPLKVCKTAALLAIALHNPTFSINFRNAPSRIYDSVCFRIVMKVNGNTAIAFGCDQTQLCKVSQNARFLNLDNKFALYTDRILQCSSTWSETSKKKSNLKIKSLNVTVAFISIADLHLCLF